MNTELFYFSGTGNSLFLAKKLADRLGSEGESLKIIPLAGLAKDKPYETFAERIGIVFPVYFYDIPDIVKSFISRLRAPNVKFLFGVSNCGASDWGVPDRTVRLAKKNGLPMNAFFRFILPDNSIVYATDSSLHSGMFAVAEKKIEQVAGLVQSFTPLIEHSGSAAAIIPGMAMKAICFGPYGFKDIRFDPKACTACGMCEKVCPVANVSLASGSPQWKSQSVCTSCFACIHYCPTSAVKFRGQKKIVNYQYRNPSIKSSEMVLR